MVVLGLTGGFVVLVLAGLWLSLPRLLQENVRRQDERLTNQEQERNIPRGRARAARA